MIYWLYCKKHDTAFKGVGLELAWNSEFLRFRKIILYLGWHPIIGRDILAAKLIFTWRWMLLLLLSHFSCVRLCATPWTAAHQAPPSLRFSRQEHWSGLPFPSPMHESEKWKWSRSVMSDSSRPHRQQPTRLLHPWDSPGKSTGVGCHCPLLWRWINEEYKLA